MEAPNPDCGLARLPSRLIGPLRLRRHRPVEIYLPSRGGRCHCALGLCRRRPREGVRGRTRLGGTHGLVSLTWNSCRKRERQGGGGCSASTYLPHYLSKPNPDSDLVIWSSS
ncbi:hypothetical protein RchiOBHm_Chr2g0158711 [Rosa chinensis]|uniref:Uncharacterized protein n=1 Tax=Rosa chinensis TaxID=74649 RepID=A0A2P6S224_ROSCH|nr:hypothetical protein RchiOBHm_Chr2g0158711 [Rosa chinensis]